MALDDWPDRDRQWAARYILGLAQWEISLEVSEVRQKELIAAAEAAGESAADVFGDPDILAAEDGAELAVSDAVVMAADRSGARDALEYGGVALILLGVIAAIMVLIGGGRVDVTVGRVAVLSAIVATVVLCCAVLHRCSSLSVASRSRRSWPGSLCWGWQSGDRRSRGRAGVRC